MKGKPYNEIEKEEEMPNVPDSIQELPSGDSTETPKNKPGRKPKLKGKSGNDPKPSEETIISWLLMLQKLQNLSLVGNPR